MLLSLLLPHKALSSINVTQSASVARFRILKFPREFRNQRGQLFDVISCSFCVFIFPESKQNHGHTKNQSHHHKHKKVSTVKSTPMFTDKTDTQHLTDESRPPPPYAASIPPVAAAPPPQVFGKPKATKE
jgi:hypothetical protein